MPDVVDRLEVLVERLRAALRELEAEEERLRDRLRGLPAGDGCTLDYRWVRNAAGRRYWYWYMICYEGGRRYHRYIGSSLPRELVESLRARREARVLAERLRVVVKARRRAEQLLERARRTLEYAAGLLEGILPPKPAEEAQALA